MKTFHLLFESEERGLRSEVLLAPKATVLIGYSNDGDVI
jgi:hypothetical protein